MGSKLDSGGQVAIHTAFAIERHRLGPRQCAGALTSPYARATCEASSIFVAAVWI
jgi:hypothetical protein